MRSAAMRTPSESTSPKPSRSPIRWISSTMDAWLPKCRSMPSGILERDDAALEEFHGEGDGDAGRHRVEAVLVGGAVGGDDGVGVGHPRRAAERVERLVLGALGHDAGVGPRLRESHLAAGHGALGAGRAPGAAAGDGPGADGARVLLVTRRRPVVGREDAERGAVLHVARGAFMGELVVEHRALLHGVEHALARRLELLGVGDRRLLLAAQGDRLEVLGAHHGAEPPATDDAALVDDAGQAGELLAGRADARDAHVLVVQLVLDGLLGVGALHPPDVLSGAEAHLAVLDPQPGGLLGDALDDDDVVAGALHLHGEVAAGEADAHRAGERALGVDRHAAGAGDLRAGEGARREDQLVVRAERIAIGGHLVEEVLRREAGAADEVARDLGGQRLLRVGPAGEVDTQDPAGVAARIRLSAFVRRHQVHSRLSR